MAETRKRSNAEIDILNQFVKEGETPLPYETDDTPIQKIDIVNTTDNENETELSEEDIFLITCSVISVSISSLS